ncbi:hypothetical protein ACFSTC_13725 [Nonomuraea ferruginea]
MPDSDEAYAYGWNIRGTGDGRIAWHDGGNGWSPANYALSPGDGTMAFWVSNHAYRRGAWNFEDLEPDLTLGLLARARETRPGDRDG